MPQILSLEWNEIEARAVLASQRRDSIVIEQAFSVDMRPHQVEGAAAHVDVGARLTSALAVRGIGKIDVFATIGRTNIELRQLSLPPAPDAELPDLVRFQAMREFNELQESWPLDFIPLTDAADAPREVLAAAISPETMQEVDGICRQAGLRPRKIALRATAAASLLARMQSERQDELRLLVDLLEDEADLTVMTRGRVVFLRTTRLSVPFHPMALVGEIRRTMAAVQNRFDGRKVESVIFCGTEEQQAELAKKVAEDLDVKTELLDPFANLSLGEEVRSQPPEHAGRFAPLIGMLLDELDRNPYAVDFLHPRKKPEPPNPWKKYRIHAAAAAVLLVLGLGYYMISQSYAAKEYRELAAKESELKKNLPRWQKIQRQYDAVEPWISNEVNWLDTLYDVSKQAPPAQEAIFERVSCILKPDQQAAKFGELGRVQFKGYVKSRETLDKFAQAFNDAARHIDVPKSSAVSKNGYNWSFDGDLVVMAKGATTLSGTVSRVGSAVNSAATTAAGTATKNGTTAKAADASAGTASATGTANNPSATGTAAAEKTTAPGTATQTPNDKADETKRPDEKTNEPMKSNENPDSSKPTDTKK